MIHFVTTQSHTYTVRALVATCGRRRLRTWTYERLFDCRSLPGGTWIFTDHERLSDFELALAAKIATRLESAGMKVLNHPARVHSRLEILRRLQKAGINGFAAWRCEAMPRPSSFPVFLRTTYDHDSTQAELLHSQGALDSELRRLESEGVPLQGKLVIEYAGEEVIPGVWQRLSTYRVGDRVLAHHAAFDGHWLVKDGWSAEVMEACSEKEQLLDLERQFVARNLYEDVLVKAFDLAGIDYGRADFSLVAGRVQIYEINTNPRHGSATEVIEEAHPLRRAIQARSEADLRRALLAVATSATGEVELGAGTQGRGRRRRKGFRASWRP